MGKSNLVDWESGHIIVVLLSFAKVSMMGEESKSLSQCLTLGAEGEQDNPNHPYPNDVGTDTPRAVNRLCKGNHLAVN